jgi:mannan endo-1,4-beta-mannosidase
VHCAFAAVLVLPYNAWQEGMMARVVLRVRKPVRPTRRWIVLVLTLALVGAAISPTAGAQPRWQTPFPPGSWIWLPQVWRAPYLTYVPIVQTEVPGEPLALPPAADHADDVPATAAGAAATGQPAPTGFVTRAGENLQLNGQPYTFVGVNASYLAGPFFPEANAEQVVSFLARSGVQVIRVWVEPWCDLERVERLLDLGKKYDVRFILTLQNFFNNESGSWFRGLYVTRDLPHIHSIVTLFADRPEILAWELMNEPTCPPKDSGSNCWDALVHWAEVTSQAIKQLDPNHLVSIGTQRGGFDARALDAFRRMHALDTVDLVSIHCEATKLPQQEYAQELAIAHELNKPVFFGEVYLAGRPGNGSPAAKDALARRAEAIAASIQRSREAGIDGYLLWQYGYGPADVTNPLDYYADDPVWEVMRAARQE